MTLAIFLRPSIFQFTPLREGRPKFGRCIGRGALFQFTPLREGRRVLAQVVNYDNDFNSRPSARGDCY